MTTPASRCTAFRALPGLAQANAAALGTAIIAFCVLLWPLWRHDDNMTHGIFLPILAGILVLESRRDPAPRFLRPGAGPLAAGVLLLLASLASLAVAAVFAAAFGWTHVMAELMAAVALVLGLAAGWLGFADQRVRFLPFNWPAAVAVGLWLFACLPPPGTYARLALLLQIHVTGGVMHVLHGLGIAAFQDGNVIELARTSVGVSEACSGVRSLISCTVAGLFLSALLVRRPAHRVLVIALSPAIGLGMNFLRSLLLTLLANAGVDISGRWHDLTGASIIVGTTLLVAVFAFLLQRREGPPDRGPGHPAAVTPGRSPFQAVLATGLLAAAAATATLLLRSHAPLEPGGPSPDLAALLPAPTAGWVTAATPDLDQYSEVLQTRDLVERAYFSGTAPDRPHLTLYLAHWRAGQAPVSLVEMHTPDACWPGSGWELEPGPRGRIALAVDGRPLPPAEFRRFSHQNSETHVWYWHLYGGRPLAIVDPRSFGRLLGLAWRYGSGRAEDQLFIRVSSNRPWEEIATEPALRQFFANLKPLGL